MDWYLPLLLAIRLSGEKSNNDAVSPKGAKSVMQFMPETWKEYSNNGKRDINNPADTIDASLEFIDWISKNIKPKTQWLLRLIITAGQCRYCCFKGDNPCD